MDTRLLARGMAAVRIGIGVALFAAPKTASRLWLGDEDLPGGAPLLARGLGARELALGTGQLVALDDGGDPAPWLDAGIASDTADAVGAVLSRRELSTRTLVGTV